MPNLFLRIFKKDWFSFSKKLSLLKIILPCYLSMKLNGTIAFTPNGNAKNTQYSISPLGNMWSVLCAVIAKMKKKSLWFDHIQGKAN